MNKELLVECPNNALYLAKASKNPAFPWANPVIFLNLCASHETPSFECRDELIKCC